MPAKTQQLQIRVSAAQKAALRARAKAAGKDVSSYVLGCSLPVPADEFFRILAEIGRGRTTRYALAALNDLLTRLSTRDYADAVSVAPGIASLAPFEANYVAAMVEERARQLGVAPPDWPRRIAPLRAPWFAGGLESLRAHLILNSPVVFRRRNLFVDATIGDRV